MTDIKIYCDGGCKGNHQKEDERHAYGSFKVFYMDKEKKHVQLTFSKANGSNEAEYGALLSVFQYISELKGRATEPLPGIEILMDSKLIVTQVTGAAKVKAANLKLLHSTAVAWLSQNPEIVTFSLIPGTEMKSILGH